MYDNNGYNNNNVNNKIGSTCRAITEKRKCIKQYYNHIPVVHEINNGQINVMFAIVSGAT